MRLIECPARDYQRRFNESECAGAGAGASVLTGLQRICSRFAEEKWYSRFTKSLRGSYNEMGLVSFSVVVYTRKSGQLAIDM